MDRAGAGPAAVSTRQEFLGGQKPSTTCPVYLVMGQMYQNSTCVMTEQRPARLKAEMWVPELQADLGLMGK